MKFKILLMVLALAVMLVPIATAVTIVGDGADVDGDPGTSDKKAVLPCKAFVHLRDTPHGYDVLIKYLASGRSIETACLAQ